MRNKQAPIILLSLSLFLFFPTACANPPTASDGSGWASNPAWQTNPAVQATLAARQSQVVAATYESVQVATRAAAQATESARVQATAIAQATAVQAATSTASAATGTAIAATATAEDLSVRGTQIALVAVQTQNAIQAAATGTHQAASANAGMTAQAVHMANAQMLQDAERQRLAAQQQRQEVFNSALPVLFGFIGLAVVVLTGLFAYLMIRSRNPVYHVEHMGNKIANEERKYGIYLAVTMTDPTRHWLLSRSNGAGPLLCRPSRHAESTAPHFGWNDSHAKKQYYAKQRCCPAPYCSRL